MRAAYVDLTSKTITWPASEMKNNEQHTIPFGPTVEKLIAIDSHFVLGSRLTNFSLAKKQLDASLPLPHWTLHDLRRTFVTMWAQLGIKQEVTERYVAHRSGKVSGISAVYNRHTYMAEMAAAAIAWEHHLASLIRHR
jgi:integrase